LEDSYLHKGMRRRLVEELKSKGIVDVSVLNAINKIPRHFFFETAFEKHAYEDKAFPIGEGQTISQPYTVAFQTQLLKIKKDDKILEIGTGSGYQSSVLLDLGVKLYSIERHKPLSDKAVKQVAKMGYHKGQFFVGDGTKGMAAYAPYDGIIVTAGAPLVPTDLVKQLKVGGKLIIPVGDDNKQKMIRLTKISEKEIQKEEFGVFSFVPLIGKSGWKK
jgi:protein-L-isoaspartate(D-aspartate) O-methyltransferase